MINTRFTHYGKVPIVLIAIDEEPLQNALEVTGIDAMRALIAALEKHLATMNEYHTPVGAT